MIFGVALSHSKKLIELIQHRVRARTHREMEFNDTRTGERTEANAGFCTIAPEKTHENEPMG